MNCYHVAEMRIKCFAMIKNEVDIVEDWLRHTLDLCGAGNLYVLDNESTDGTESILQHYRPHVWSETVKANVDGAAKGQLVSALMREHRHDCDLLVPLDGDEFIGLQNSWDRDGILGEFEGLDTTGYGRFKFTLSYEAIAAVDEVSSPVRSLSDFVVSSYEFIGGEHTNFAKTFYAARSFVRSDNGNHFGESECPEVQHTSLWLYHYPARSLQQYQRKILQAAAYSNYWKTHRYSTHWQAAYRAYLEGRLLEYYESAHCRHTKHRRITWPATRLQDLDTNGRLPTRHG